MLWKTKIDLYKKMWKLKIWQNPKGLYILVTSQCELYPKNIYCKILPEISCIKWMQYEIKQFQTIINQILFNGAMQFFTLLMFVFNWVICHLCDTQRCDVTLSAVCMTNRWLIRLLSPKYLLWKCIRHWPQNLHCRGFY